MFDIIAYIKQCVRVLNVASRPRQKEFEKIVEITGIGMIIVGLVGAVLAFLFALVK
jgi:protein translocase SEC61 complex gamma subunit